MHEAAVGREPPSASAINLASSVRDLHRAKRLQLFAVSSDTVCLTFFVHLHCRFEWFSVCFCAGAQERQQAAHATAAVACGSKQRGGSGVLPATSPTRCSAQMNPALSRFGIRQCACPPILLIINDLWVQARHAEIVLSKQSNTSYRM